MIDANELKQIKSVLSGSYSVKDITNKLMGYYSKNKASIRTGGYATVFVPRNRDYVIKYVNRFDNEAYTQYAKFCKTNHKKYEHLPKIYAIFYVSDFAVFIMEKLQHNAKISRKFNNRYIEYSNGDLLVSKYNPIYPILNKIQKIMDNYGSCADFHNYNNIMVRSNGIPVITDPITD